jgi:hypothetical protein
MTREKAEEVIFGPKKELTRRFTQDSPVLPDVWISFLVEKEPDTSKSEQENEWPLDLLLTPIFEIPPAKLSEALRNRLLRERESKHWDAQAPHPKRGRWRMAHNASYVVARLWFDEVVRAALPLTKWWRDNLWIRMGETSREERDNPDAIFERMQWPLRLGDTNVRQALIKKLEAPGSRSEDKVQFSDELVWLVHFLGSAEFLRQSPAPAGQSLAPAPKAEVILDAAANLLDGMDLDELPDKPLLWLVSLNRPSSSALWRSRMAVKADAANRVFDLKCNELAWAVIDGGIDATHPAFRKRDSNGQLDPEAFKIMQARRGKRTENCTRVIATYDFTNFRNYLDLDVDLKEMYEPIWNRLSEAEQKNIQELRDGLYRGRAIDWSIFEPLLRVPHDEHYVQDYSSKLHEHGTHVAGILAGDWRMGDKDMPEEQPLQGMCPDLRLLDLRVLRSDGLGDEFGVLAALQFVHYLNSRSELLNVHGVNISMSIRHDVANYACGRTPICMECDRLVDRGVVVVAAAGNDGYIQFQTTNGASEGYRSISITDPGNASSVITVGSTHRFMPNTYGVSFFSSRGPTGDGRSKPDLVAPGEKIKAPIPQGRAKTLDGTSMAAPHVSGAAALLMARYAELVGNPDRIKEIICKTATDLGRERYFQGTGMLDVLRALQSI